MSRAKRNRKYVPPRRPLVDGTTRRVMIINKKVVLGVEVLPTNGMAIMSLFRRTANRQGWTDVEVARVLDVARRGDYLHLVQTIHDFTVM